MEGYFLTDTGKLRPHNEDSGAVIQNNSGQYLALVADGMGGHQAGDVASKMACDGITRQWEQMEDEVHPEQAENWIKQTISDVNSEIYTYAMDNPQCAGMGTTLTCVICTPESVTYANIGDSRVYLFHDGSLKQISKDHSLVGELVRSGQLTEEEAENHPRKNVLTKALGTDRNVTGDVETFSWTYGDLLLLCSDGLTNMLDDSVISGLLKKSESLEELASTLIKEANAAGGEDNISVSLVRHSTKDVNHE